MAKRSTSGRTVINPTGTASYKNKRGQFNQATREAVKSAGKKVIKSAAKSALRRTIPGVILGTAYDLAKNRGAESFKNLKELKRGKLKKGLNKVKPLPADKPKAKAKAEAKPKAKPKYAPKPKRKPVSPETMEFLKIKKTRIF